MHAPGWNAHRENARGGADYSCHEQYSNSLKGENITFGRHQTNLRLTGPIRVGGCTWREGAGGVTVVLTDR